jgi:hypothetical protein
MRIDPAFKPLAGGLFRGEADYWKREPLGSGFMSGYYPRKEDAVSRMIEPVSSVAPRA